MSAIELTAVEFSYATRKALHGVSFSVEEGHTTALLGPNGGGKTTIFKILSTLMRPDGGAVQVIGHDLLEEPFEVRRSIGVVFQGSSLDVELTTYENLVHQGHLYGLRGDELQVRIDHLLDRFKLADRRNERAKALSGGLRRRIELAKALLHLPRIILLDEPTSGLDPSARAEFWNYLFDLKERDGLTILLTTHSLEEAERCDDLVILSDGVVVASGSPDALKSQVGGEVIIVQCPDSEGLGQRVRESLGLEPLVLDGELRIEQGDGHRFVGEIMERFGSEIEALTVSRPSLEDVFIHETGHKFDDDS
jgi:ABC-2 type transport system ATP-binding protein